MSFRNIILLVLLGLACTGSSADAKKFDPQAGTNNPPSVVGTYFCDDGCGFGVEPNEDCKFPPVLQVSQTGSAITMDVASENDDWSGTINDKGQFSVIGGHCNCVGDITSGKLNTDCVCDTVSCQNAIYKVIKLQ